MLLVVVRAVLAVVRVVLGVVLKLFGLIGELFKFLWELSGLFRELFELFGELFELFWGAGDSTANTCQHFIAVTSCMGQYLRYGAGAQANTCHLPVL